ncbi:YkgJ family cysteine cluster protein [bacterium]|nr:YkgJ family cysteine cluster protein [bacterium]
MNSSEAPKPVAFSSKDEIDAFKDDLEKNLLPLVFQHVMISFLKNKKLFTPDFITKISSLYKQAELSHQFALKQYQIEVDKLPKPACKKGCSYCCGLTVKVAIPELYIIYEHIQSRWGKKEIERIRLKLESFVQKMDQCKSRSEKLRIPCAFLENNVCSIYEVRPLPCHAWNSTDVNLCILYLTDQNIEIPSNIYHYEPYDVVKKGIMKGLFIAGFDEAAEELNSGLLRLFEWEDEEV